MRTLSRRPKPAPSLLFMVGMMTLAAPSPSAAQGVCQGFDRKHTITRLGGPNAFSPGGTHKRTRAELREFFAANAETIRGILASRGIGDDVANALLEAVRNDTGITERPMPEGERLEWMAYRKRGKAMTIENVCMDLRGSAPAFVIAIPVVTAAAPARPDCSIDVTTDLPPGGPGTLSVRTAPGARVTLEGPAGSRTVIEGGASSWTGPWNDPHGAEYAFTVTNQATTTETITTYTFLVPRECLNLAFIGRTEEHRQAQTCTDRRTVARLPPPPLVPPPPPPQEPVVVPPEAVAAAGPRFIVRPFVLGLFANGETHGSVNPGACPCPARTAYGYDDGFGLGIGVEWLLNERIGIEGRVAYARLRGRFRIEANAVGITESRKQDYWDLSVGLNFHLFPSGPVDWYVGPFVGYATVKGHTFHVVDRSLEYDVDGEVTFGAQTGVDIPFGRSAWSLHFGARYTHFDPDVTERYTTPTGAVLEQEKDIDLHPISLELGVAFHF